MNHDEIDDLFHQASGRGSVDPVLLGRISGTIGSSLKPVRPLPSSSILIAALSVICVAVAGAGAALLGLHGIRSMDIVGIALIFPALGLLICIAAAASVSEMIPGSRRVAAPWTVLTISSVVLIAAFALVFHKYEVHHFVAQGLACLTAGLLQAIPAAVAVWLVLRRGFGVNDSAAALAYGTLAGLAGVLMLELHCANFEAPHVMLWHTAVIPLSAAAAVAVVRAVRTLKRRLR